MSSRGFGEYELEYTDWSRYLGSVAICKDFKLEKMVDDHPVFAWAKKHFGLSKDQIELQIVKEPDSLYHDVLHIFSNKPIENISTLRKELLLH